MHGQGGASAGLRGPYRGLTRVPGLGKTGGDVDRHYLFKPRSNKTEKGTAVDEFHFRGGQIRSQNQPPKWRGLGGSPERENFCV